MDGYTLNQLAVITGLTTRTLRNYIGQGILQGEKNEGVWRFTEEDLEAFLSVPHVNQALAARRNALVHDFMADTYKKENRICILLDFPVEREESADIAAFFSNAINENDRDIEFRYAYERSLTRVILSGAEEEIVGILRKYYRF